jgi:hypothetical protein
MPQNKYYFVVLLVVLSMVSAVVAMAVPLSNPLNKHNLSSSASHGGPKAQPASTGGTDQICIFCHTPHSATPESTLWSRPDPNTTSFPLYNSALVIRGDYPGSPAGSQGRSQYGSGTYPSGASRLCLSCHDGVTAMGILNDGTSIAMLSGKETLLGTQFEIDLSTSHPISFVYDNAVLGDLEIAKSGTYQLPLNPAVFTPLDGENKMQCTTCHDPHEDTNEDALGLPFWRHNKPAAFVVGPYEDVCNQCHIGGSPGLPADDHDPGPEI